jgi:Right handed beta helix region
MVFTDYSDYLLVADLSTNQGGASNPPQNQAAMTKQWEMNQKPTLDFILAPDRDAVTSFVIPSRGCEIRVDTDTYPNFFTGFINSEAEAVPLSSDKTETPVIGFSFRAMGEEVLLDMNRIGFVPSYVNKTDGQIIADLITRLEPPGRFTLTSLPAFGDPEPIFKVHPDLRLTDILNNVRSMFLQKSIKLWFKRGVAFLTRLDERPFNNPSFLNWLSGSPQFWTKTGTVTEETTNVVRNRDAANFVNGTLTQPVHDALAGIDYIAVSTPYQIRVFAQATGGGASLSVKLDTHPGLALTNTDLAPSLTAGPNSTPVYLVYQGTLTTGLGSVPTNLIIAGVNVLVGEVSIYPGTDVFDWAVTEQDPNFAPFDLSLKPVQSPIRNDLTAIGDVEQQNYVRERYVADGISTDFPMKVTAFGTNGKPVVEDNFDQGFLDSKVWQVIDPSGAFDLTGGSLNVLGGLGLDATTLYLQQGIEIKNKIRYHAGEFNFQGAMNAIVGALYSSLPPLFPAGGDGTAMSRCVLGWRLTPAGGGSTITVTNEVPTGLSANELPAGAIDGSNKVFTFKHTIIADSLTLMVNGYTLLLGVDFTLSGAVATLVTAPFVNSQVIGSYDYSATAADGISVDYATSELPLPGTLAVTVGGSPLTEGIDYQLEGNDIVFTLTPAVGAAILCSYQYASGGQTVIQPIVNGALYGTPTTTRPSKNYEMEMLIDASGNLTLQPWYSLHSKFGGGSQTAPVKVIFRIVEYDTLDVRKPQTFQPYEITLTGALPAFVFVGELAVNNVDVGVSINGFQVEDPIQGTLLVTKAPIKINDTLQKILGFVGDEDADATVTVQNQGSELSFFQETRQPAKARIEFRYRSAGLSIARVVDTRSIADEATRFGDSGLRASILYDINPLPDTSINTEAALQAYLSDSTVPQFEGDWTCLSPHEYTWPEEPIPGRFFTFYSPSMLAVKGFEALVRIVQTDVFMVDDGSGPVGAELYRHKLSFGEIPTRNLERTLTKLSKRTAPPDEAVISQTLDVASVDTTNVATQFIADITVMRMTGFDPTNFYFDIGMDLGAGQVVEVRWSDDTWGQAGGANLIGRFSSRHFFLNRIRRDQWMYARLAEAGVSPVYELFSRYSGMCRQVYPLLPPAPPKILQFTKDPFAPRIEVILPTITKDIFGIHITVPDVAGGTISLVSDGPDTRVAQIFGIDNSGFSQTEFVTLNGTTTVHSSHSYAFLSAVFFALKSDLRVVTIGNFTPSPATAPLTIGRGDYQLITGATLHKYEDASFGGSQDDSNLFYTFDNSAGLNTTLPYAVFFYNLLDEYGPPFKQSGTPQSSEIVVTFPPPLATDCLDFRAFAMPGDPDDTAAIQRALDQAAANAVKNLATSQTSTTAPTVVARPTTLLNGWGSNGHVGNYEHGVDQGIAFFGLDTGTTNAYTNPGNAVDTDPLTFAQAAFAHTHQYAGCVWSFGALPSTGNVRRLNILSEIPVGQTFRSAGIWISFNGGANWTQVYNLPAHPKGLDTLVISSSAFGAGLIQVMAFLDSHDDMVQNVYDINISEDVITLGPAPPQLPTVVCIPNGVTATVSINTKVATDVISEFCHINGDIWTALQIDDRTVFKVDGTLILNPTNIDALVGGAGTEVIAAIMTNKCDSGIQKDGFQRSGMATYPTTAAAYPDMATMNTLITVNELGCRNTGIVVAGSGIIDGSYAQYKDVYNNSTYFVGSLAFFFLKSDSMEISGVTLQNFPGDCAIVGHSEKVHIHDIRVTQSFSFLLDALRHSEFNNNTFDNCPIPPTNSLFSSWDQGLLHLALCQNVSVHDNVFSNNTFGGNVIPTMFPMIMVEDISFVYEWGLLTQCIFEASIDITNNRFLNNKLLGPPAVTTQSSVAAQIRIHGGENDDAPMRGVNIVGNSASGCGGGGIVWTGLCDSQITNNAMDVLGLTAGSPIVGAIFEARMYGVVSFNVQILNNTSPSQKITLLDPTYSNSSVPLDIAISLSNPGIDPSQTSVAGINFNASVREVPTGAINGSNTSFGLAHSPINGVSHVALERVGVIGEDYLETFTTDFTLSGSTLTLAVAPPTGAKLFVTYMY